MNRQSLRGVDLHLLIIFEAIIQERNITKAGHRLSLAQSSVSAALKRLRVFFSDPVLIRVGQEMEPTARALEILNFLSPALDSLSIALGNSEPFYPESTQAVFRLGMSDDTEIALLPCLINNLRQIAPGVKIVVVHANKSNLADLVCNGVVSLAITSVQKIPEACRVKKLSVTDPLVLKSDLDALPLSIEDFCRRPHVQVSPISDGYVEIDRELRKLGLSRNVVMTVPSFSSVGMMLIQNPELLSVLPRYVARIFAQWPGLASETLPIATKPVELSMVWMPTYDKDASEKWIRDVIVRQLQ